MAEHRKVQHAHRTADTEQVGTRRRREAEDVLRMAQHRRSMQALNRAAETAAALAEAHSAAVADADRGARDPHVAGSSDDARGAASADDTAADTAAGAAAAADTRAVPAENVRSLNAARAKRYRHPAGSGRA